MNMYTNTHITLEIHAETHVGLRNCALLISNLKKIECGNQILVKLSNTELHENLAFSNCRIRTMDAKTHGEVSRALSVDFSLGMSPQKKQIKAVTLLPCRRQGRQEVYIAHPLLDLGTRWGGR
jgi:hypothetical protein